MRSTSPFQSKIGIQSKFNASGLSVTICAYIVVLLMGVSVYRVVVDASVNGLVGLITSSTVMLLLACYWTVDGVNNVADGIQREMKILHPAAQRGLSQTRKPHDPGNVANSLQGELSMMNFGQALDAIKAGRRVTRTGWNGHGMFVYLVPAASYPVQTGAAKEFFGEGAMVPYAAYMAIKNVNGTVSTWTPSVNDCLSEDWAVAMRASQELATPHNNPLAQTG